MKKLMFAFMLIFLIASVSALEFDNRVTSYDHGKQEVVIENMWGIGSELGRATLNTPLVNYVEAGPDKLVAEFTIDNKEDGYANLIKQIDFYERKGRLIPQSRDFTLRYATISHKQEQVTSTVCDDYALMINCRSKVIGTEQVEVKTWNDFDSTHPLPAGEIIIGVFTDVIEGERVEWIPTLYGVLVPQWAEFVGAVKVEFFEPTVDNGKIIDCDDSCANGRTKQDFTIGITGSNQTFTLVGVTVALSDFQNKCSAGETFNVTMYDSDGSGFATGSPLSQNASLDCAIIVSTDLNNPDFFNFSMPPIILAKGGHYVIEVTNNEEGDFRIGQSYDSGNGAYLGGFGSHRETSAWVAISADFWFQVWGTPGGADEFPIATQNFPTDGENFTTKSINLNYTGEDDQNVTNVTLYIDDVLNTTTIHATSNITNIITNLNFTDGTHAWFISVSDNASQQTNSSNLTFTIDSTPPLINIIFPFNEDIGLTNGSQVLNWTVADTLTALDTCIVQFLEVNTTIACGTNSTLVFNATDNLTAIVSANDSAGNFAFNVTTFTFTLFEDAVLFNTTGFETERQRFEINFSTIANILSVNANLIYNGTTNIASGSCVGSACTAFIDIDLDLVAGDLESEIKEFHWEIDVFNGTGSSLINSTSQTQNVSRIHLTNCAVPITTEAVNFTASYERNLTRIVPYNFGGTFDTWLGTGTVVRNNSFDIQNTTEAILCISPDDRVHKTDATIEYSEDSGNTVDRNYYFQNATLTNTTQHIPLYLLESSFATTFILKARDNNLIPIENALIFIQKFYPEDGVFRTVQISKTDDTGTTVGFFEIDTVLYRFLIVKDNEVLLLTAEGKVSPETAAPFILTFTKGSENILGAPFEDLPNLVANLSVNRTTNVIMYTYIDTSGTTSFGRLLVQEEGLTTTTICNINSTQASATLVCNVTGFNNTIVAKSFISRSPELITGLLTFVIKTLPQTLGLFGVFLGIFVIMVAGGAFLIGVIPGVIAVNVGVIVLELANLVSFGSLFIFAMLALSVFIMILARPR